MLLKILMGFIDVEAASCLFVIGGFKNIIKDIVGIY